MRFYHKLILILWPFFSGACAIVDLETIKGEIVTVLRQEQPKYVEEFNQFFKRYDELVFKFFDQKNNDSLKTHVHDMEAEIEILKNVCADERYRSISNTLRNYHTHVAELVGVLKQFVGSRDTISLALRVRKFKPILPKTIRQRGRSSLLKSLHHRLRCSK